MNLQKSFYKIVRTVSKNLPTILTCVSAFGVFATGYFSAKAAHETIKTLSTDVSEFEKEEWKEVAINYIPAIASAMLTVGTMATANKISKQRIKGLTAAYTNLNTRFNKFKLAAMGALGTEGYKQIMETEAKTDIKESPIPAEENEFIFYDYFSHQDFLAKLEDVIAAQYDLNRLFVLRGYVMLNDYYALLGLPQTSDGAILGWSLDSGIEFYGYEWIDFINQKHEEDDGSVWYSIFMPYEPTIDDYYHYGAYDISAEEDLAAKYHDELPEGVISQKLQASN